jgi:O-antigen ligase/tetratricopeptide (TPR) repeat protein
VRTVGGVTSAIGGRHPVGQALLTVAAMLAVAAWLAHAWRSGRGSLRWGVAEWLLLAGLGLAFVQIVPLPPAAVDAISPRLATLLPECAEDAAATGRWKTISLVPDNTLSGLLILFAQAVYVWVFVGRIHGPGEVERFLRVVAGTTICLALLGITQYLFGNGRFLWFYEPAFGSAGGAVKGTFTNRNHFAGFLAIGFGTVAWLALADGAGAPAPGSRRSSPTAPTPRSAETRLILGLTAMAVVAFATALSLSRGGTLALCLAASSTTGILLWSNAIGRKTALGMLAVGGLLAAALAIHGSDTVGGRLETLLDEQELAEGFSRLEVWKAAIRTMAAFPWLGTGVGTHAEVSPIFMPPTGETVFTHAESSYLTLGVEAGLAGLVLAGLALVAGLGSCLVLARSPSPRERGIAAAAAGMLAAGAGHAVGDFTWYAPAISTLLLAMGAGTVRLASERVRWLPAAGLSLDRFSAVAAASGLIAALSATAVVQAASLRSEPAWETAIRQSLTLADEGNDLLADEAAWAVATATDGTRPDDTSGPATAADNASRSAAPILAERQSLLDSLDLRIATLEGVVGLRPTHPRAWAELAVARLERFGLRRLVAGESLTLLDLRQTVQERRFATQEEALRWVALVAGGGFPDLASSSAAAHRAVRLAPCAGDAWCVLGALAFLESDDPAVARRRIAQAMLVRPHHPLVLFEAAIQASIDGDDARTTDLMRRSFAASRAQRDRIIALLLPVATAEEACELLEPDLAGLRTIDRAWADRSPPAALRPVRERRLAKTLEEADRMRGPGRSRLVREAAALERTLGDTAAAARLLRTAVAESPFDSAARLQLADLSMATGDLDTAAEQLEWCLLERPDAPSLKNRLESLRRLRLAAEKNRIPDHGDRLRGVTR